MEIIIQSILKWLMGTANKPAQVEGNLKVLEYSLPARLLGSLFLLLFGISLVIALMKAKPEDIGSVWGVVGSLFLISLFLFIEFFRVRISFDASTIYTASPWRRNRKIPWPEVKSVVFSQANKWYLLKTSVHGSVRASLFLSGIGTLVEELKKRGLLSPDKESR